VASEVEFVWVRNDPSELTSAQLFLAFQENARPRERLGAFVHHSDGRLVLELYARNVMAGLTDDWLEENWGIRPCSLPLTPTEKLELTIFALFLHLGVRRGLEEEARTIVRLLGRVVFRAAVRGVTNRILKAWPRPGEPHRSSSPANAGPIGAEEVARTDYDALFRKLLNPEDPNSENNDRPGNAE
jgi:hypothetical protein